MPTSASAPEIAFNTFVNARWSARNQTTDEYSPHAIRAAIGEVLAEAFTQHRISRVTSVELASFSWEARARVATHLLLHMGRLSFMGARELAGGDSSPRGDYVANLTNEMANIAAATPPEEPTRLEGMLFDWDAASHQVTVTGQVVAGNARMAFRHSLPMDAPTPLARVTNAERRSVEDVARAADLGQWSGVCDVLDSLAQDFPYEATNEADEFAVLISDLALRARDARLELRAPEPTVVAVQVEESETDMRPRVDDIVHAPRFRAGSTQIVVGYIPPLPSPRPGFTLVSEAMPRHRVRTYFVPRARTGSPQAVHEVRARWLTERPDDLADARAEARTRSEDAHNSAVREVLRRYHEEERGEPSDALADARTRGEELLALPVREGGGRFLDQTRPEYAEFASRAYSLVVAPATAHDTTYEWTRVRAGLRRVTLLRLCRIWHDGRDRAFPEALRMSDEGMASFVVNVRCARDPVARRRYIWIGTRRYLFLRP